MARVARRRRQTALSFEAPDAPVLARRAFGEAIATAGLAMAVIFSAQASWLGALRPLALGLGVPAAVAALTLSFGPATGAHFNPLVTTCQWVRGHRNGRCLVAYVCAQYAGALAGALLAVALIPSAAHLAPAPVATIIGGEVFASAGLLTVILATSQMTGPGIGLMAVVGWLIMVNLAAPAGPFANPVLALAVPLATGSLKVSLVLIHVAAEIAGATIALLIIALTYPRGTKKMRGRPSRRRPVATPAKP